MRAWFVAMVSMCFVAQAAADSGPELSADGKRIALPYEFHDINGGVHSTRFCSVGVDVDDQCTSLDLPYTWSGEGGPIDNTRIEKQLADMRAAGGFKPLPIISLHRIALVDEFAPQRLKRARVSATSGDLKIVAATARKRKASITVSRGKRVLASGRWGCSGADERDQAGIVGAVIVGSEDPEIYANLQCSQHAEWVRVPKK